VQLPEIAVIQKPAHQACRDLACTLPVELVPGHGLEPPIGTNQRSLETSMEKAGGLVPGTACSTDSTGAQSPNVKASHAY
jgi:hypothetical protein